MSTKNPTVSELIEVAQKSAPAMTDATARIFLKAGNIRSFKKLETLAAPMAEMSAEEIDAEVEKMATEAGVETPAEVAQEEVQEEVNNDSQPTTHSEVTTVATGNKAKRAAPKTTDRKDGAKREGRGRARRAASVVKEGPRGFRFGDIWNQSVMEQAGIAVAPTNFNKLMKQAEILGVKPKADATPEVLAGQVARMLEKHGGAMPEQAEA